MTDDHETLRRKFRDDIEANWATLSPAFRAAHNQLRQARGQLPIPPPKVDLYVAPSKAAGSADPVNPASVPADTAAKTKARRGVAAVKLKHPLKHRASRDTYSPAMMRLMLRYYGLALPEIEHILHLASPNKDLREALAGRLWDYLRGIAGKDGSGRERPAETAHYAARLHELVQPLRDLLQQLVYAPDHDQSAGMIVINLFAEGIKPVELLDQLEHLLRVTQSVTKSRGGQQPDYDHHCSCAMWRTSMNGPPANDRASPGTRRRASIRAGCCAWQPWWTLSQRERQNGRRKPTALLGSACRMCAAPGGPMVVTPRFKTQVSTLTQIIFDGAKRLRVADQAERSGCTTIRRRQQAFRRFIPTS
jgi:hypothetical protein